MRDRMADLERLDVAVIVISFEPPDTLRRFRAFRDLPFTVASDPTRAAYAFFGLHRRSLRGLLDGATIRAYLRGMAHGRLPRRPAGDVYQLGGNVILDREGRVVSVYRSETPGDRPSVDELLATLPSC